MAVSNRDRVNRGLELLAAGLYPFVLQELKATYKERWPYEVAGTLRLDDVKVKESQVRDVHVLLRLMWDLWNPVFGRTLGQSARTLVSELRDVRNRWAHMDAFSADDAYRALDSIQRLLTAVSAEEAIEVEREKKEVLRLQFEEQQKKVAKKVAEEQLSVQPQAGLKPWREVVTPHKDVREGRYQLAEFAADLAQVERGEAGEEYQDPHEFFRRTFLTEGLRDLLVLALKRLSGLSADPVVKLQTNFGGGKTHALLALYHLTSGRPVADLPGVDAVLAQAGVTVVPKTTRAILVGTALSPGQPHVKPDGTRLNTLWGELAYRLGGREGYELLRQADETATNPGEALTTLFRTYAPCLVLVDEWVAYARQLHGKDDLPAGTFATHATFAQTLSEAAHHVPEALVVVSVPASDAVRAGDPAAPAGIEVGGEAGRETLAVLDDVILRKAAAWVPASKDEGYEIVRRRLFEEAVDHEAKEATVQAFARLYQSQAGSFPQDCKEASYARRLRAAYPVHPELFDRLYEDWSTLEKFQRTRGVLRLMASVIHELWEKDDPSLVILPGTVPIHAPAVQAELTRYLEDQWTPVIQKDIDGPDATPVVLDRENPNLKRFSATRRVARTVYLGSAPTLKAAHRGLEAKSITLGTCQPGESPAIFGDALRHLGEQATYLYEDSGRYWFSLTPSVNRLARDRAEQARPHADEEILRRLRLLKDRGSFAGVHVAPESTGDVPDEPEARLVILPPSACHALKKEEETPARSRAASFLASRGDTPRRRRNALVFLAPDQQRLEELRSAAAQFLAWKSIDEERVELSLGPQEERQAKGMRAQLEETCEARIKETYIWLLVPDQTDPQGSAEWAISKLTPGEGLAAAATKKLTNDGLLVTTYGAVALRHELDRIPLWRNGHVSVRQLWDDFSQYLYLPRLRDEQVLLRAVQDGVASFAWQQDTFAYAESYDEAAGRYQGLVAQHHTSVTLTGLVVRPEAAAAQLEREKPGPGPGPGLGPQPPGPGPGPGSGPGPGPTPPPPPTRVVRRFHASKRLDPMRMGRDASEVAENVVQHLSLVPGARVQVTLEIEVDFEGGSPSDKVVRDVGENCNTLKFEDAGFEKE